MQHKLIIMGLGVPKVADLKVGYYDLTKARRVASGDMKIEYITTKRRVDVVLKMIKDSDLGQVLSVIGANKPLLQIEFAEAGKPMGQMTCYVGDITTTLWHTINGVRYWEEVSLAFIEQ